MTVSKKKPTRKPVKQETKTSRTQKKRIELYAQERVSGKNQSDAFRVSHPHCVTNKWKDNTIHIKASQFEKLDKVQIRIKELSEKLVKTYASTIDRTVQELSKLSFVKVKDFFDKDGMMKEISKMDEDIVDALDVKFRMNNATKDMELFEARPVSRDKFLRLIGLWLNMWHKDHIPTGGAAPEPEPDPKLYLHLHGDMNDAGTALERAMAAHERLKKIRPKNE